MSKSEVVSENERVRKWVIRESERVRVEGVRAGLSLTLLPSLTLLLSLTLLPKHLLLHPV